MRLIKMLGLAMVAAIAAMAFVGATGAQAVPHDQYGLCKAAELLLCKAENLIPVGSGVLLGTATNPELVGNLNEVCESSKAVGKITGALDEKVGLKGEITSLTFTGCKPCTSVTVTPPLAAELKMGTIGGEDWKMVSKGNAKFTGCPFGVTCKFGTGAGNIEPPIEMNATDTVLNTNGAVLTLEEGSAFICGSSGKWFAKYLLKWTLLDANGKPIGEHNVFPTLLGTA